MGSFFGTWNWYDFWRRRWGLPCSRPLLRTRCWFVVWRWCVSCSWTRCLGGLKTRPPRRHRIQFVEGLVLDPRAKETCFKKGSESEPPWNQKRSPLEGPISAPSLWQIYWNIYFKLKLISPATAAARILNWGGPFLMTKKSSLHLNYCIACRASPIHGLLQKWQLIWTVPASGYRKWEDYSLPMNMLDTRSKHILTSNCLNNTLP